MTSRAESCPPKLVLRNTPLGKPNAALQGAALAFSANQANAKPSAKNRSTANGATAAAAAAGTRPDVKKGPAPRIIEPLVAPRPVPIKSPSLSAAQAASAKASPPKDVVVEKISSVSGAMIAYKGAPKRARDPIHTQKTEENEEYGRGWPWSDNTIAVPQPVRHLPHPGALTAVHTLEPDMSPVSTPNSASPPVATSYNSEGISAARAAARHAAPAMRLSDHSSDALVESTPEQSLGNMDSLLGSRGGFSTSLELDTSFPTSSIPVPHSKQTKLPIVQNVNKGVGPDAQSAASSAMSRSTSASEGLSGRMNREPETAASSAMKRTTSLDENLQLASKTQPKHDIAADALIAWSVASSRAASPTRVGRPLTLRRRSKSFGMFHHNPNIREHHSPLLAAPVHKMKQTMRKHPQTDEDDEENEIVRRGRRHFIRKHQHKHHEGDRKRWRDRVTEKERKRYEGVWAANRGLFTFWDFRTTEFESVSRPPEEMDAVLNIVVRDIWERSRLPRSELEEVWDLVAREDENTLRRDEFVVGLWLLDQRLKGRKLPMRVSASVWASVRHTLKIRAK